MSRHLVALAALTLALAACPKPPAPAQPAAPPATAPAAGLVSKAEDPKCVKLAQALFLVAASGPEVEKSLATLATQAPLPEQCAAFLEQHARRERCTAEEPRCAALVPGAGTAEEEAAAAASELWLHEGCAVK